MSEESREESTWEAIKNSTTAFLLISIGIPALITFVLAQIFGLEPPALLFLYAIPSVVAGSLLGLANTSERRSLGRGGAELFGVLFGFIGWMAAFVILVAPEVFLR